MRYEEFNLNESYPKHQDLSGISTDKLKAYLARQGQQAVPGEGGQVKRVQAELQRRSQGVAEGGKDVKDIWAADTQMLNILLNPDRKQLTDYTPEEISQLQKLAKILGRARKIIGGKFTGMSIGQVLDKLEDNSRLKQRDGGKMPDFTGRATTTADMGKQIALHTNGNFYTSQGKTWTSGRTGQRIRDANDYIKYNDKKSLDDAWAWVQSKGKKVNYRDNFNHLQTAVQIGSFIVEPNTVTRDVSGSNLDTEHGLSVRSVKSLSQWSRKREEQGVAEGYKEERLKGCKCQHRQGDNKKCPIHGVQEGVAEGMLDNPGEQDSPVAQAIIRRILLQRTDLLAKHGPEKVGQAVDEVADFVGDVDEIGSSDVSGWIRHVEQMLGNMSEGVAEAQWKNMDSYERDYAHSVAGMSGKRNREDDEHHEIDQRRQEQLDQYTQSGKFWLKFKDSGQHVSSQSYVGKAAATAAAHALLRQQPELKGNLLITAYGPGGE